MRRSLPISSLLLALAALLWHAVPLATASPQPPYPPPGQEVRADAFSVAELAADARGVKVGGGLAVAGLRIGETLETLDLERFEVFAADAEIVVHGDGGREALSAPDNAYFRGRVSGAPESRALLTVNASGRVRGLVRSHGKIYLLRPGNPGSDGSSADPAGVDESEGAVPLVAEALEGLDDAQEAFTCGNSDISLLSPTGLLPPSSSTSSGTALITDTATTSETSVTSYTATVAVETDWEYYQNFGNATDATDYVGDLIAYASTIYDSELETNLLLGYLSLWTTSSDPWTQASPSCALFEFGQYWNYNNGDVDRTVAHFVSGKNNGGGVAWVGVLCRGAFEFNIGTSCTGLPSVDLYGGDYGYTGDVDGDFDPDNPAPVWDIVAVSHEIGHNFNSPHTHCYEGIGGSSSAVDECFGNQSGSACYSGSPSYPAGCPGGGQGCGTIMSYCHFLGGGLNNIALTLGEDHPYGTLPSRVPDRMRAHVESRASLAPACLARINPCTEDLELTSGTDNGTESYSVCGTITAGGSYKVGSSGDVTMTAGKVVLTDGFRVESGGTLRIDV